ncbi:MAG: hypothetical protein KAW92_04080, partial [Candidatus Cloacimonetes bacterium]|nr:hypothetical protein [Candidatus Cloacimonadota bacterium]
IGYNTINNCDVGIRVREDADLSVNGEVHYNDLSGNTSFGIKVESTSNVDAENNWWGSANGPEHADNTFNVGSQGDVSSDYVDYVPWFDTSMAGNSFAPVEKDDGLKTITYFSSIQTAINAASTGDIITGKAGIFDEQFTVDEAVTIQGTQSKGLLTTIQPTAAPVPAVYDIQVFASNVTLQNLIFDFGDRESVNTGIVVGEYGEPLCPASVTNVTIQNNELYGDGNLIQTGYTIDIGGLLIDSNDFYLGMDVTGDGAEGVYVSPFPQPGKGIVTISNNNFYEFIDYAIAVDASYVNVTNNTIDVLEFGSVTRAAIRYIDWYGNDNTDVNITLNEIYGAAKGIWVESHEGTGTLSGTIQYNYFTDCNEGILLATGLTTSLEITENDFVTTAIKGVNYAVNNTTTVLADCENNWWDSVNGPNHAGNTFNVTAQGGHVTDYVDYVPWLDDEFDVGIPFAPVELYESSVKLDKNKLREENLSFKDVIKNGFEQFSSIQTAIDAYDDVTYDWAGIACYAGTFTEDFVADKDDIWFAGESTKQLVTLLGDQEVTGNYVWFDNFEFDPQAGVALLLNSSAAPIDGTWIDGCTFTIDESGDVGIYVGGSASPNAVTYTDIENSIFNGPTADKNSNPFKVGGWFGTNIGCEIDGLVFYNNEVNYGSIPINIVDEIVTDLYIGYNDFLNTDGVIYFWNNSGTPPTGELSYFDFSNNYVPSSNSYGIAIGGASLGGPTFTDANFGPHIAINDNAFEMSGTTYGYGAVYMADQYTGLLDASENWWGDANGPENDNNTYTPPAAPKGRATVSDRVEFAPWYKDGTNTAPARGWMPLSPPEDYLFAPVINVTASPNTYHSSIQRGVDGATAGDSISCLAGTFDECVTIDKNVKIAGDSSAKGTTYLAPSFAHMDAATVKNVTDAPVLNADFQSVLFVDYTGTALTTIKDFVIDGSAFNTGDPASGGYFAGILFDETAGTVANISFNDIYTLTDNKGVGVVVNDNSGTDKTTEVVDCDFNACPTGALWLVHPNAMGNIHDNTLDGSRNTIMFLSSSSTTASIVDNNTLTNCTRAVVAYPFNADVKIDITDNTFDFSGTALATSVDAIIGNSSGVVYSFELNIENNDFIGNYPPGSKPAANDSKPINFIQNCTGTTITNNTFDNFYRGIFLNGGSSVVTDLTITNNVFTDIALNVISIEAGMVGVGTMAINYNSFDTNSAYAIWSVHATTVDAEKNWYGDATGPVHTSNPHNIPKVYGDGAPVSDNVDFIPWYATSTVTPSTEYVRTHGSTKIPPQQNLAFADFIQACINAAADVYYFVQVTDAATPYTENLTVDNQAYIYGGGNKASPPVTIVGTHTITGDNVTFDNLILTNTNYYTLNIDASAGTIDNIDITNCTFNLIGYAGVHIGGDDGSTNLISDVTIDGNTFNGPASMASNPFKIGGYHGHPGGCNIDGVLFQNNWVDKASIPVNLHDQNINDIQVRYNTFTNTDGIIYFWNDATPTGVLSNFVFANNDVNSTNTYGIGFDETGVFTDANYGTGNAINNNSFDGILGDYGFGAVTVLTSGQLTNQIDATNNWWGSRSGPIHSGN